jgi:hypothetical protein
MQCSSNHVSICHAHVICLHFIILIIFGEEHMLWNP